MSETSRHPTERHLREFVHAEDEPRASERVEQHLLTGCVTCLRKARRIVEEALGRQRRDLREALKAAREGNATQRLLRIERRAARDLLLVEAERRAAPGLIGELLLLPTGERRAVVRSEDRYQLFGLAEALTQESRRACFTDVDQAVALGELAREVADTLNRRGYPPGLAVDGLALAWGALGNAHRARTDLTEAEWALKTARGLLAEGSQDASARAEILSLIGSLRTTEARFGEAVEVLEEAAAIYRAYGNLELEAKTLMKLGNAAGESGQVERAAELLGQARERLGWDAEGELSVGAAQAHVHWLLEAGDTEAARRVMETVQEETRGREVSFYWRQRLDWVGARLTWAEGDLAGAEAGLEAVRERYGESEQAYRYCLVSLDKAQLLLEQGRTAEVRRLADEMLPVFRSRRIHHHALQALVLFQKAAEAESVTIALVQQLTRYLRHAQNNPDLAFRGLEAG